MNNGIVHNVRLIDPGQPPVHGWLRLEDGRIAELGAGAPSLHAGDALDGQGQRLTPGLIDLHTHGLGEHGYDQGADALRQAAALAPQFGVTSLLPTIVPRKDHDLFSLLKELAEVLEEPLPLALPGLHVEGPFVALAGAACDTRPGELEELSVLLAAAPGQIRAMSLSPDTPGILPLIRELVAQGITPFLTHTRASVEETLAAIDAGARHATHFYNVFPSPPETDPGVRPVGAVETLLADARTSVDFIADGCHVHPMAIRLAIAALGWQRVCLITDSNIGAGLPPGVHPTPWGFPVRVEPDRGARVEEPGNPAHGSLAGSALTMDEGMRNLLSWLDLPEEQIWALGTRNPAEVLGLTDRGRLQPGQRADLVLWNDSTHVLATWCGGKRVHPLPHPDQHDFN